MLKVAGIGEILFDILPKGKMLGGAPANFAFHSKILGLDSNLVSAIGNDTAGTDIRQILSGMDVSTEYIQCVHFPTGTVKVTLDSMGIAKYDITENVAWDHIAWTNNNRILASEVDAVCFGSLAQRSKESHKSIQNFLAHTKDACLKVFDINLRQNYFSCEIIESSLQMANVLKLNEDELDALKTLFDLPKSDEKALGVILNRYKLQFIAFTQGAAGSTMIDHHDTYHCPGIPVPVKDTIGAGDSFTAAMIMGKLHNLPLSKINRLASKVAASVCSQHGATPIIPSSTISELQKEIQLVNGVDSTIKTKNLLTN